MAGRNREPWSLLGPDDRPERPALAAALRNAARARRGAPTEADAPPVHTFPMTKAARAAIELRRQKQRGG